VPARGLYRLPDQISFDSAASIQVSFGTAWHMLMTRGRLRAGETVLVMGAAGNVGLGAVRIAKLAGGARDRGERSAEKNRVSGSRSGHPLERSSRRHQSLKPLTVFQDRRPFVRSATLPAGGLVMAMDLGNGITQGGLGLLGLADTGKEQRAGSPSLSLGS